MIKKAKLSNSQLFVNKIKESFAMCQEIKGVDDSHKLRVLASSILSLIDDLSDFETCELYVNRRQIT